MFKIKLANGEFYKNNSGRTQHFKDEEHGKAKIEKLGTIASGATVVECKAKTAATTKDKPKDIATEANVAKVSKTKKSAAKARKVHDSASSKGKTKKNKK